MTTSDYVYNFGPEKVAGRLTVNGPKNWNLTLPQSVQAAPGDRIGLGITLDVPKAAANPDNHSRGRLSFGRQGRPVVPTSTGGAIMNRSKCFSVLAVWSAIIVASVASAADRGIPKPLAGHPGNVFLAGEQVAIDFPAAPQRQRLARG